MAEVAKLYNLMRVEWLKIRKRPRTWVLAALLVVVVFAMASITNFLGSETKDNWKEGLIQENQEIQSQITALEDVAGPAAKQLEAKMKINEYHISSGISPFEMDAWSFVSLSTNITLLVGIFACVIAGDIVASEFTWGTVKMLLIRPVSRSRILFAKYMVSLLFGLFLFVLLFASAYLIGGLFFGFGGMETPHMFVDPSNNTVVETTKGESITINFGLKFVTLFMAITIAFMISTIFRSSSLSIAISILLLLVGPNLMTFLAQYEWAKYLLFANTELIQHIEGPRLYEDTTMGFSIAVLAVYFVLMNAISWIGFKKRDVGA